MQGFGNNIYNNAHDIIVWDSKEGNNNVDRGTVVTADASDVGNGGGNISEGGGGVEYGAGYLLTYTHTPLGVRNISHNNIKHNRDSDMDMENKNDTQRGYL